MNLFPQKKCIEIYGEDMNIVRKVMLRCGEVRNRLIIVMLLLITLIPIRGFGDPNSIDLYLGIREGEVLLLIVNGSARSISLNKRFEVGADVEFLVENRLGKVYDFLPYVNMGKAKAEDYVVIHPGGVVGRSYYISEILSWYGLSAGYENVFLTATYVDKSKSVEGAFSEVVKSNRIELALGKKRGGVREAGSRGGGVRSKH